ncbi:MAG TPA: polysaccharide deacetylase family protein [Sedimentisphaerales bacterium]|nr:polysaccharide deacetylase family protein [Sedimentisphaerales bacterium]
MPIYYVDATTGDDGDTGLTEALAWKTISKVNGETFAAGDSILFKRGETWNERLTVPSAGAVGNLITFGAYGSGALPVIAGAAGGDSIRSQRAYIAFSDLRVKGSPTGYYDFGILAAGNTITRCWIGDGSNAALRLSYDTVLWYCLIGSNTNATSHTTMAAATSAPSFHYCIFAGQKGPIWASDGLTITFNGCLFTGADGTVIKSTTGAQNINLNNCIVAGNASPSYVLDHTGTGAMTVTSCLLLPGGNSANPDTLAWRGLTDGGGNIYELPKFKAARRPGIVIPRIDESYAMDYAEAVAAKLAAYGWKLTYGILIKDMTPDLWARAQALVDAGHEIASHTRNHADLTILNAIKVRYVGAGSVATMTINVGGDSLTTTVDGGGDLNLTLSSYANLAALAAAINGDADYTSSLGTGQLGNAIPTCLADIADQDIKTAEYTALLNQTRLFAEEIDGSISDINSNLSGYTVKTLILPYSTTSQAIMDAIQAAGLIGASANSTTYSMEDFEIFNVPNKALAVMPGDTNTARDTAALGEWLNFIGGVETLFSHGTGELSLAGWDTFLSVLAASNVRVMSLTDAITYIKANGVDADSDGQRWTRTFTDGSNYSLQAGSPAIDAGTALGSTYAMGLNPNTSFPYELVDQRTQGTGWEIGAFVFVVAERKSNYAEKVLIDHILNKINYANPTTYVALFVSSIDEDGSGSECSSGSYARQLIYENGGGSPAWNLAVAGGGGYLVDNSDDIEFPACTADWGIVTDCAIFDAPTSGNMLYYAKLAVPKPISIADILRFPANSLGFTEL